MPDWAATTAVRGPLFGQCIKPMKPTRRPALKFSTRQDALSSVSRGPVAAVARGAAPYCECREHNYLNRNFSIQGELTAQSVALIHPPSPPLRAQTDKGRHEVVRGPFF